jgi:AcrR family transcriptional regulator
MTVRPVSARNAETHARILDAATALFAELGYEGTKIRGVAERAKVSRSAVFWHFGSKEALFQEAFQNLLTPFLEQFEASATSVDPRQRLLELVDGYEVFVREHRDAIEPLLRWVLESPSVRASLRRPLLALVDRFTEDVAQSFEQLVPDPKEAASLAASVVSLLNGSLVLSFVEGSPEPVELRSTGLHQTIERLLSGLPDPPIASSESRPPESDEVDEADGDGLAPTPTPTPTPSA